MKTTVHNGISGSCVLIPGTLSSRALHREPDIYTQISAQQNKGVHYIGTEAIAQDHGVVCVTGRPGSHGFPQQTAH